MTMYHYTIEIFNAETKQWNLEDRYYHSSEPISDDFDVEGKRRNVTYIGEVEREYVYSVD